MRPFRSLLLLLALALAGAVGWTLLAADPGQVFIRYRGWDVDTSVPYAVLLLVLLGLSLWLLAHLLTVPLRLWRRARHRLQRSRLVDGLLALHEGRWSRAEALLLRVGRDARLRVPALIGASRAADGRGDGTAADTRLAELDASTLRPAERSAVDLAAADRAQAHGDPQQALARLDAIQARGALPPRALVLKAHVLLALGRAAEARALLPGIKSARALPAAAIPAFETHLLAATLSAAGDDRALESAWEAVPADLRPAPSIVTAYAQRAAALGREDAAVAAVERGLAARWSEDLALLYGLLPAPREDARLGRAEAWLESHPNSPGLLVTLGRLCRQRGLWGKAEDMLHRAIAQGAASEAWEVLGEVLAEQGEDERARISFHNALRVARAEATQALPGRDLRQTILDEAVAEERDAHGLPRLPLP